MSLDRVRAVADAVLYEGYLLYPYRATSRKNQVRWQFGVLGPPGAAEAGSGEEPGMATQCLLDRATGPSLRVHLRFLQLQTRTVERYDERSDRFLPVDELVVAGEQWLSWDEAVAHEVVLGFTPEELTGGVSREVGVEGHEQVEQLPTGRVVRRRWPVRALVTASTTEDEGYLRLEVRVGNLSDLPAGPGTTPKDAAVRASLIGSHLVLEVEGARFVSLVDPPGNAAAAARRCVQHRCWPVLAGEAPAPGAAATSPVVLASPIILYDFPEVATQSAGDLFDATEIDEILTLRVMTMTDEEKAEARATDPRAREIIDRCDRLSPASLQQLHGVLRDPHVPALAEPGAAWWDPAADESVHPDTDSVVIDGVPVAKGSLVRVHPSRRADAQDLFFDGRVARVTAVLSDVDGGVHVALVLEDDPAADLHDWYGRYWYFAPDELEPLPGPRAGAPTEQREETPR